MNIVTHRTVYFWITGLILAAAVAAIAVFGLPLSIDFTGGSMLQVRDPSVAPAATEIQRELSALPLGAVSVRASGASTVSIRTRTLTPA